MDLSNLNDLHGEFSRASHEAVNAICMGDSGSDKAQCAADDLGVCLIQAEYHGHVSALFPQVSLALCLRGILAQWFKVSLSSD